MSAIKIEGRPNLERRGASVVNTSKGEFLSFLALREKNESDANRIIELEETVKNLTQMMKKLLGEKND